jgi:hypothetical protein
MNTASPDAGVASSATRSNVAETSGSIASAPARNGADSGERTVPGCSAAKTASGRWRQASMAAVRSSMFNAAFEAR